MISATLAKALEPRRNDFNARLRLAAQRYPQLDGQELLRFVRECLDPLICAVARHAPAAVDSVLSVAYDSALQLTGQRLTLESGRYRSIPALWREVLPLAAASIAEAPARMIASLSNAAHHLAGVDEQAASQWQQRVAAIIGTCASAEQCLLAARVLAWRSGLAHYRHGAVAALQALPVELAGQLLGVGAQRVPRALRSLQDNPWLDPAETRHDAMRVIRRAGAFRGFGGAFLQPPLVRSAHGGWLVRSAGEHWFLCADVFGATLHRASDAEWQAASNVPLEHAGTQLVFQKRSLDLPEAGPVTSAALSLPAPGETSVAAACTFAHSHQIALLALS